MRSVSLLISSHLISVGSGEKQIFSLCIFCSDISSYFSCMIGLTDPSLPGVKVKIIFSVPADLGVWIVLKLLQ